ncbi:PLC-like phosphodiesterase [Xylaria arbuscula]|nr:PLC-like phosphodiesterase [Xylaria arbuscula]
MSKMPTATGHPSVVTAHEQSPLLGPENEPATNPAMLKQGLRGPRAPHPEQSMPQTIGHRGFSAVAPENTMASFKAAAKAGVDALETDLHLTRDGVVVLCHDETLQRCYGIKAKVRDLDWSEISRLRTIREPRQPMPRLIDLLEYLDQPGLEDIGLMLDIKTHDDAEEMMKRTADALASVPSKRPWNTRVMPCCWKATYIKLSMKYLPDYPITHVGFSIPYARCLVDIPNISFSLMQHTLASSSGGRFLREMKQSGIPVYIWTVNQESWMEWSIRKGLSGVVTDEVALFHDVCNRVGNTNGRTPATTSKRQKVAGLNSSFLYQKVRFCSEMAVFHFLSTLFWAREWWRYGSISRHISRVLDG